MSRQIEETINLSVKLVDDHLIVEPEQEAEDLMVAGNEILIGNRRLVFHLAKLTSSSLFRFFCTNSHAE